MSDAGNKIGIAPQVRDSFDTKTAINIPKFSSNGTVTTITTKINAIIDALTNAELMQA